MCLKFLKLRVLLMGAFFLVVNSMLAYSQPIVNPKKPPSFTDPSEFVKPQLPKVRPLPKKTRRRKGKRPKQAPEISQSASIDNVVLSDPLEIERALQKYVLYFAAYRAATRSRDPEIRALQIEYLRSYRQAYTEFLLIARRDGLYRLDEAPNIAGKYDRKSEQVFGYGMRFPEINIDEVKVKVAEMVQSRATPVEVSDFINLALPDAAMTEPDLPPPEEIGATAWGEGEG